jgi:hypothetical protein
MCLSGNLPSESGNEQLMCLAQATIPDLSPLIIPKETELLVTLDYCEIWLVNQPIGKIVTKLQN